MPPDTYLIETLSLGDCWRQISKRILEQGQLSTYDGATTQEVANLTMAIALPIWRIHLFLNTVIQPGSPGCMGIFLYKKRSLNWVMPPAMQFVYSTTPTRDGTRSSGSLIDCAPIP